MKKLLALTVASLLAAAVSVSAQSVLVTVNGNNYDISAVDTSFNASTGTLESQPWWGSDSKADAFATAVGTALGFQSAGSALNFENPLGPLFTYATDPSDNFGFAESQGIVQPVSFSGGSINDLPLTFAEATLVVPVPESSANPGLMAAAGLFIGWRSWRAIRAARA